MRHTDFYMPLVPCEGKKGGKRKILFEKERKSAEGGKKPSSGAE